MTSPKTCLECGEELNLHEPGGRMSFFWQCEECGGRWFPGRTKGKEEGALRIWNREQAYKKMLAKKGGGSKSNVGRKKVNKKKVNNWLYET